jgi:hypothetical protein
MKRKTLIILSTLILLVTNLYAHKDRIERPIQFKFVFDNHDSLILNDTDKSSIDSLNQMILNGEKELANAIVSFETGEQIEFKYIDSKLDGITIVYNKKVLTVPKETINKLQEVHFQSIALLWDERDKRAFSANYFMIQFDVSTKQDFGKYPYVQLNFSDLRFTNAIIWRQISENSKQWKNLE